MERLRSSLEAPLIIVSRWSLKHVSGVNIQRNHFSLMQSKVMGETALMDGFRRERDETDEVNGTSDDVYGDNLNDVMIHRRGLKIGVSALGVGSDCEMNLGVCGLAALRERHHEASESE